MNHDSGPPSRTRRDRIDPRALGSVLVNSRAIAIAALRHGLIVFANPAFLATFRATNALVGTPLADIVVDAGAISWLIHFWRPNTPQHTITVPANEGRTRHSTLN